MDVRLEKKELTKILSLVNSAVERRQSSQILSNTLIRALSPTQDDVEEAHIQFTVTNLDLDLVAQCPAQVLQAGVTTAPVHLLYETARRIREGEEIALTLDDNNQKLKIKAGAFQSEFATLSETQLPLMSFRTQEPVSIELDPQTLLEALEKTRVAIATDEARPYLGGIYLCVSNQTLHVVATDGHRLAKSDIPLGDGTPSFKQGAIVPRKTTLHMADMLTLAIQDKDIRVKLEFSTTKIRLSCKRLYLTSKLIDGTFPDYERVIPKDNDKELIVESKLFKEAIARVTLVTSDRARIVEFHLEPDRLTLVSNNPDIGFSRETIPVHFKHEAFKIGFNARYLIEIIDQIGNKHIALSFLSAKGPTLIQGRGQDGGRNKGQNFYVLMPVWI